MTRSEYLNELDLLEKKFANESFVFDKVDWWVLIKIQIAARLHSRLTLKNDNSKNESIEEKVKTSKVTLKDKVKFFSIKNKFKSSNKRIAVFTYSSNTTTLDSKGNKINQYTEPFLKYFKNLNLPNDVLDLSSIHSGIENYYFIKIFYQQKVAISFNKDFSFQKKLRKLDAYFEEKKIFNFSIYNLLKKTIVDNQSTYLTYHLFFKNSNYKVILFYCYYDNVISAINRAAKENSVRTIEYQHSLLSNYHYAYARWTNRIINCENFFPSIIWVWRDEFKTLIESNFQMFETMKAINGGNVFNSNFKLNSKVNFQSENDTDRINVLITLQGVGLPEFIKNFIVNDSIAFWYIRFHPRYPMDKPEVLDMINRNKSNIDIIVANETPLQELFQFVDYHITSYSGCALEAEYFNVKNLIFGEDGYYSYKSKIDNGVYEFIDSEEDLMSVFDEKKCLKVVTYANVENLTEVTVKKLFDLR